MKLIYYIIEATLIVLPCVLGAYLLILPREKLSVQYQNIMLKYTRKPLKDEDFQDLNNKITIGKVLGFCLLGIGITIGVLISMGK